MVERLPAIVARMIVLKEQGGTLPPDSEFSLNIFGPGGAMDEDAHFRAEVLNEMEKIKSEAFEGNGQKIPLYSNEDLRKAAKHKTVKPVRMDTKPLPFDFWYQSDKTPSNINFEQDPEKGILKAKKILDKKYGYHPSVDKLAHEERIIKKRELRKIIGLPVVKDMDGIYKCLVRSLVHKDISGIFNEYYLNAPVISEELNQKIAEVKEIVEKVLDPRLNQKEKFALFNNIVYEKASDWRLDVSKFFRCQ